VTVDLNLLIRGSDGRESGEDTGDKSASSGSFTLSTVFGEEDSSKDVAFISVPECPFTISFLWLSVINFVRVAVSRLLIAVA